MADKDQVKILRKSVKAFNKWREENPEIQVDLSRANLRLADLSGADLSRANLNGAVLVTANLNAANLYRADLHDADLSGANLSAGVLGGADLRTANLSRTILNRAILSGTIMYRTNLHEADLRKANLSGAILSGADLRTANLGQASVAFTVFADLDLSQVKGLHTIKHYGPSAITISTVYLSQGKIPFEFLRGAGVPDNFIEYMHSLVGTAFEFYSCFISYSSKDRPFAERLHADLQNKGVRCWFAPHHGQAGQKLHEQIDQAIRLNEKLLLILSTDSMKSEWVKTEIKKAAKRQAQEKKDVLFPVSLVPFDELREWECFDGDLGKDLGAEIREYLIPDFRRWKEHDSYQKAFAKLLRDLRSGKTRTA